LALLGIDANAYQQTRWFGCCVATSSAAGAPATTRTAPAAGLKPFEKSPIACQPNSFLWLTGPNS
jgi:hypothetical protein